MDTTDVGGLRIAFERAGTGPALVLLQGFVGDGSSTWRNQIDALCDRFTVVAWDAPGAGGSSDPPEDLGIAGYADVLARFVADLHLERPHVCGLSFGGALAVELSRRHPEIPRSLVLASAYAGWVGSLPADEAKTRLRRSLDVSRLPPDEFTSALLPSMFAEGTPADRVDAFGESMRRAFHPIGFRAMARASAVDLRDALPGIRIPTLLVYGAQDTRAPLAVAHHLRSAIAGSRLVVLPNAGHLCTLEAPEEFNAAVRDFLLNQPA